MNNHPYSERHYRSLRNLLINLNYDLLQIHHEMLKTPCNESDDFSELEYFVMALEDRRFLRHCGFDFLSLLRDILKIIQRKKHGGFSTIDMQMVRTITNFKEKTFYRKLYEIILSLLVNFKYTKKQIIRCYLANAYFGSHLIGVKKVSLELFKQETYALNQDDQAFIAAMLLRPKPLKASDRWYCLVRDRASYAKRVRSFVKKSFY